LVVTEIRTAGQRTVATEKKNSSDLSAKTGIPVVIQKSAAREKKNSGGHSAGTEIPIAVRRTGEKGKISLSVPSAAKAILTGIQKAVMGIENLSARLESEGMLNANQGKAEKAKEELNVPTAGVRDAIREKAQKAKKDLNVHSAGKAIRIVDQQRAVRTGKISKDLSGGKGIRNVLHAVKDAEKDAIPAVQNARAAQIVPGKNAKKAKQDTGAHPVVKEIREVPDALKETKEKETMTGRGAKIANSDPGKERKIKGASTRQTLMTAKEKGILHQASLRVKPVN
jgi:hypothetical protein